jgi:hypothetical protein
VTILQGNTAQESLCREAASHDVRCFVTGISLPVGALLEARKWSRVKPTKSGNARPSERMRIAACVRRPNSVH